MLLLNKKHKKLFFLDISFASAHTGMAHTSGNSLAILGLKIQISRQDLVNIAFLYYLTTSAKHNFESSKRSSEKL